MNLLLCGLKTAVCVHVYVCALRHCKLTAGEYELLLAYST